MKNLKVFKGIVVASFCFANVNAYTQKNIVPGTEVPIEITNYVNQHFKGHPIRKVTKEIDNNKINYEVKLDKRVELEFDENFTIMEIEFKKGISTHLLPTPIVAYIQSKYPGIKIIEWKINKNGQEVELGNKTEIYFNVNGDFIK